MNDTGKYPEKLYKYRSWADENHRNVLLKNQLFLASPKDFNDPFDCRIPTNFHLLDSPEKIKQYADEYTIRQFKALTEAGIDIEKHFKTTEDKLKDIDKLQHEHEKMLYGEQDKRYGILSLSLRWDSILMWSHYSDFHKGYCVGFWEEKLRNSGLIGAGGPVIYNTDDNYPLITPLNEQEHLEKSFIETHYKAKDWSYEKEFRLTRNFYQQYPTISDRIIQIPDDFFVEIIIGVQATEDTKEQLKLIAKSKNIPIYQATKVPFKFLIDRVDLRE